MQNSVVTLSFGHLRFRPECVVILGVQCLHGLMYMILISHMFAFFKRLISAKPECSRGGGGSLLFSACVGSRLASIFHPKNIRNFKHPKIFYPSLRIYENIRYPPPPPTSGVFLLSYTRCPSESDKTGVMKIATRQWRHCLHCHWRRFISVKKTIIEYME